MPPKTRRATLNDILVANGYISAAALAEAQERAKVSGVRLENYLTSNKLVSRHHMVLALSEYLRMPPITLSHFKPPPQFLQILPKDLMTRRLVLPIAKIEQTLTVALANPFDLIAVDEIETQTGLHVIPLVAAEEEITEAFGRLLAPEEAGIDLAAFMRDAESEIEIVADRTQEPEQNLDEMLESAEGAPVIRMVNMILVEALRTGASDIHIEPMENKVRLRYRIDGTLVERPAPPKNLQNAVISRVKIMADLDIAERRRPQDGRFNIKALGKEVDLRVSILPTVHGEKVVLRILDKTTLAPSLSALGLDPYSEQCMRYAINQPHGIILVTGPTGSGKTTTLYSCLQDLNQPGVNIVTCEDPVEYKIEGINQSQMHPEVGLTFASALRSILRQDPDIILVGEIRDGETAEIAIKAALTGHLVLSTLHTNDAAGAVTRLIDMGIEPFMLGSALILAQAQRLYRKLCPVCKRPVMVSPDVLRSNGIDPALFEGSQLYGPAGCPRCNAGFKGRAAIMEVLLLNDDIREAVLRGANTHEIRDLGIRHGMIPLRDAALQRVREGVTSLETALEVVGGGE